MIRADVTLGNKLGLHARAAAKLVAVSGRFQSRVGIGRPGQKPGDGKSIMAMLMLAAPCGTTLSIECDGPDEQELLDALRALVADKFDEGE